MITLELAQQLKDAGLRWQPRDHDFFAVPEREMDDRIFVISDMSINMEILQGWPAFTFNGSVEWALDYVLAMEVVWLPNSNQLLTALGQAFTGLTRREEQFVCALEWGGKQETFAAATPDDAYAQALLTILSAS